MYYYHKSLHGRPSSTETILVVNMFVGLESMQTHVERMKSFARDPQPTPGISNCTLKEKRELYSMHTECSCRFPRN